MALLVQCHIGIHSLRLRHSEVANLKGGKKEGTLHKSRNFNIAATAVIFLWQKGGCVKMEVKIAQDALKKHAISFFLTTTTRSRRTGIDIERGKCIELPSTSLSLAFRYIPFDELQ